MNKAQQAFLRQARACHAVFLSLMEASEQHHHCHALHYLQMTTELFGKAFLWRSGTVKKSHSAFTKMLRSVSRNSAARQALGFEQRIAAWEQMLRSALLSAYPVERLAPDLAESGPNPEYPWPPDAPATAPVDYEFECGRNFARRPEGEDSLIWLSD